VFSTTGSGDLLRRHGQLRHPRRHADDRPGIRRHDWARIGRKQVHLDRGEVLKKPVGRGPPDDTGALVTGLHVGSGVACRFLLGIQAARRTTSYEPPCNRVHRLSGLSRRTGELTSWLYFVMCAQAWVPDLMGELPRVCPASCWEKAKLATGPALRSSMLLRPFIATGTLLSVTFVPRPSCPLPLKPHATAVPSA